MEASPAARASTPAALVVDAPTVRRDSNHMSDDHARRADETLEKALAESGARDPREFYRERLRDLKKENAEGYEHAVEYYRDTLIPTVADGRLPALDAWTEYGRILAESLAPGRTIGIDSSGRSHPYEGPDSTRLVLHLPEEGGRAILLALPPELSGAQRASYDVLVRGKQRATA